MTQNFYIMCTHSSESLVPIYQTQRRHIRRAHSLNGYHSEYLTCHECNDRHGRVVSTLLIREVLFNDAAHCWGYTVSMEHWWNNTDSGKSKYWRKKSVPLPLSPAQIPHGLGWDQTLASAMGSPAFKSRPGDRLLWQRIFSFPPGKCRNRASNHATTASFHTPRNPLIRSLINLPFDNIKPVLVTASLKKPQTENKLLRLYVKANHNYSTQNLTCIRVLTQKRFYVCV